ncbi:MAG: restriction endonuclease subunit S [Gammaproteobacteria bacterium]|nr:restriction endonuclease subunit S [Gammaproteobacteria bacterium]
MVHQSSDAAMRGIEPLSGGMGYAPYSAYKDSGVEWLGEIPTHWEVKRLKYSATINDETLVETTDPSFVMSYIDISGVDSYRGIVSSTEMTFEDAPSRARRVVRDGDTIISTVRTYLGAIAPIRNPDPNTIVSTGFATIRPREISPDFISYVLREASLVGEIVSRSLGVSYPAVNESEIETLPILLPNLDEQYGIAAFLDRETTKIDTLIEKQERLIELLQEKRITLISHTVTKGLDSSVPMKDPGIEWLGEIPAHWEVTASKKQFSIQLGKMLQRNPTSRDDIEVPYLKARHVQWFLVDASSLPTMWISERESGKYCVQEGDLVVCEGGEGGRCGLVKKAPNNCIIQNALHRVREAPNGGSMVEYLQYVISAVSSAKWFDATNSKATIAHFTKEKFNEMSVPVPSHTEQCSIATFLDRETAKIDTLISKVYQAIKLKKEFRSALISAAVTGKIDVRQASASTAQDA